MLKGVLRFGHIAGLILLVAVCATFQKAETRLATGEHVATINGATIAYHVHGKGPICIVHGGFMFWWNYLKMPELEQACLLFSGNRNILECPSPLQLWKSVQYRCSASSGGLTNTPPSKKRWKLRCWSEPLTLNKRTI